MYVFLVYLPNDQDEQPLAFRYVVQPNARVQAFTPKALTESTSMMDVRATMFGAVALGHFCSLPQSKDAGTYWEAGLKCSSMRHVLLIELIVVSWSWSQVRLDASVPSQIIGTKPKFWLTGVAELKAGHALQLQ